RDAVGNVLERWRGVNGSPRLIETTYDPFHRLESFDHGLTGAWGAYLYDAAGNRKVSVLGDASGQFPATREYDYLNGRLSAVLLPSLSGTELLQAWNADGSLKARYGVSGYATQGHDPTRGTITVWRWAVREDDYVYHAAGKLIRTASFDTTLTPTRREAQYRYDALGRRVLVWNQGGGASGSQRVYRYLYVGDHVAYILPSTSNLNLTDANQVEGYLVDPVTGHTLKHWNNAERHRYHHRDEQGTLLYITNENGGPEYMAEQGYDPFGIPLGGPRTHITTELTPDAYLGREQDTGARGLVYLRNRYYDPYTGRFTQEDPIGFAGGINLYAYAGNNPASYT